VLFVFFVVRSRSGKASRSNGRWFSLQLVLARAAYKRTTNFTNDTNARARIWRFLADFANRKNRDLISRLDIRSSSVIVLENGRHHHQTRYKIGSEIGPPEPSPCLRGPEDDRWSQFCLRWLTPAHEAREKCRIPESCLRVYS
jgi:hypothetical protein